MFRIRLLALGPALLELLDLYVDADAEVDPNLADGVAEIREAELGIATGVAHDDVAAAPADHFVESQVLEMAAVRQVDVAPAVLGQSKQFVEERTERPARAVGRVVSTALFARVGQPPSQPDVEQRHQESDRGR